MNINISGIDVQINKKNIKNMHLSVKPPLGNVVVSAPLLMSQKSIENFVRLNFGWKKTAGKICKSAKNDSPSICER